MTSQGINELRPFRVTIIYMVEERTRERIRGLRGQLQACGIDVFLFSDDMTLVESHAAEMQRQIENADAVIICYSENFDNEGRGYRHQEVRIAQEEQRKRPPGSAYLITINLDECPVPLYLSEARVVNYFREGHFAGIMRWGLIVRRDQLIKKGEKIREFNYHLPQQETVNTPKQPRFGDPFPEYWNVPYRYTPFFTGRDSVLADLFTNFTIVPTGGIIPVQALTGLGGLGKTQTAVAYAFRYRQYYQTVIWIKAEREGDLLTSFATMAKLLALPDVDVHQRERLLAGIGRWLTNTTDWLLILDNADNLKMIEPFLSLKTYSGHLLLTTRATATSGLAQSLPLTPLTPEEGALCLLRRASYIGWNADLSSPLLSAAARKAALDLSELMGGLPLALEQAGAYIETTGRGVAGYLKLYEQYRPEIQINQYGDILYYRSAVAFAWTLAHEVVKHENPAAIELLHLCAYLAPDAIPYELFPKDPSILGSILGPVAANPLSLDQAFAILRRHSLINNEVDRETDLPRIFIHRVLQEILKDGMDPDTQHLWAKRAVHIVALALPLVEWSIIQAHVCNCLPLIEQWNMTSREADIVRQRALAECI